MADRLLANALIAAALLLSAAGILLLAVWPLGAFLHFGWPLRSALAWDAGLSMLFFLQHSVMVRRPVRAAMKVPEQYQGAVYAVASGAALTIAMVLWQRAGEPLYVAHGAARMVAYGVAAAATAFLAWGALALRGFDPCGIEPVRAHLKAKRLRPMPFVVRGPYRWVRHPLYFAIIVLFWCYPEITPDRLLFNLLWTGWMAIGSHFEEKDLVAQFGERYRRYQRRVPALIPWKGPANLDA